MTQQQDFFIQKNSKLKIKTKKDETFKNSGNVVSYENWGNSRARLTMISGNSYGRDNFYIHNSTKGFSHSCLEVGSGFFSRLTEYAKHYDIITLTVKYLSNNSRTLENTWKFTKP